MIYDPLVWFNPGYMIHCGIEARKQFEINQQKLPSEMRKAIEESFAASILALGLNKLHNMQLRVQLVNPQERSPDIHLMYEVPMPESEKFDFKIEYLDVEVVTLEDHSDEQVDDFLKRTKLAAKKSYDKETIILCYINKNTRSGKLWRDVSKELSSLKAPNDIFLLGKTSPTDPIYRIARINPTFGSLMEFGVLDEAKKKYDKSGGTLFADVRGRKPDREPKRGINPFLES